MTDTYLPRELSTAITKALSAMPVVVISGLRQAGKTTLLTRDPALGGRRYLSLDDFATLEAARRDPEALVDGADPLTIDEVQRAPELLIAIKRAVDRRRSPGQFVLSGSANLSLLGQVSESLAGRALTLTLQPFSRRERLRATATPPFLPAALRSGKIGTAHGATRSDPITDDEILAGGLPPAALAAGERRHLWFLGYEQTYLERDLRALAQVADLVAFRNLLRLAALRTGQILNQSDLARDARLPVSTVTRYLGLLEVSYVVQRLPPFLRSRAARLIKSPKLMVTDSGLAAHLTDTSDLGPTADEPLRGPLLETWVHQNLASIVGAHEPRATIGYWSVQGRHEVDLVVTLGRRAVAVEVKSSRRVVDGDLAGLRAFRQQASTQAVGILAYRGEEILPMGDGLYAVPIPVLVS